ncbi:hypothetical protein [Rhizobium ruizarguesonis]|uniref:hypothetical protein n=1 Tax=Rhizobium ruizarguesonis TaxID=2081791 RepID=UPI0013EE5B37|nr:hypothetical protein [Rhizobium ruizarguesonis]
MTANVTDVFFRPAANLKRFLENFAFHRLLTKQALQLLNLVLKRGMSTGAESTPKHSQDTAPNFVSVLRTVAEIVQHEFCVGFFNDPMQKIYTTGAGSVTLRRGMDRNSETGKLP